MNDLVVVVAKVHGKEIVGGIGQGDDVDISRVVATIWLLCKTKETNECLWSVVNRSEVVTVDSKVLLFQEDNVLGNKDGLVVEFPCHGYKWRAHDVHKDVCNHVFERKCIILQVGTFTNQLGVTSACHNVIPHYTPSA